MKKQLLGSVFNFNYLPSNVSFNINRQYNRQQFRQVDVQGLVLILCIEETLHFNYQYGFNII
jgi:hypothetical protein